MCKRTLTKDNTNLDKDSGNAIFAAPGELAHLARALAWHARGNRFDSGILHSFLFFRSLCFKSPSGDFCVYKMPLVAADL